MQETRETGVWSLGWEAPLEEGMASHSSTLVWRIPWTEEPGGLQSTGSQRAGHEWAHMLQLYHNIVIGRASQKQTMMQRFTWKWFIRKYFQKKQKTKNNRGLSMWKREEKEVKQGVNIQQWENVSVSVPGETAWVTPELSQSEDKGAGLFILCLLWHWSKAAPRQYIFPGTSGLCRAEAK